MRPRVCESWFPFVPNASPGGDASGMNPGELPSAEKTLLLVRRRQGDRTGVTACSVHQVPGTAAETSRRGNEFHSSGHKKVVWKRPGAKDSFSQGRGSADRTDPGVGQNIGVLEIWLNHPGLSLVKVDDVVDRAVVLQRRSRKAGVCGAAEIAGTYHRQGILRCEAVSC